jgi:hypothetical protein
MQELLRDLQRLAALAGPLQQFLEIRSDGMLSQRLEQISADLQALWGQIETHTDLIEKLMDGLEAREEMLARLDSMEHRLDRLLQVLGQAFRSRQ